MKKIKQFLFFLLSKIKKLFFDNICAFCRKKNTKNVSCLCEQCLNSLPLIIPKFHQKTKILIYALGKYDGVMKFITRSKYKRNTLLYYALEEKILLFLEFYQILINIDIILPIPKFSLSRIKHSFNPNEIIANIIQKKYKIPIFYSLFTKKFKTQQVTLSIKERKSKDKDIFIIPESQKIILKNKKILLIDDVYTTGATIEAARNALKNISYESITVFVLASS